MVQQRHRLGLTSPPGTGPTSVPTQQPARLPVSNWTGTKGQADTIH